MREVASLDLETPLCELCGDTDLIFTRYDLFYKGNYVFLYCEDCFMEIDKREEYKRLGIVKEIKCI